MGPRNDLQLTTCSALFIPLLLFCHAATLAQMGGVLAIGGLTGRAVANRVAITELPQLVAAFHSFVGAAAVLTAGASYMHHMPTLATDPAIVVKLSSDWAATVIGVSRVCTS